MSVHCIRALVSGRVQGVFFRESTRREAQRLGVSGHAINLADGRVEVLACGESEQVAQLVGWLHTGPEYARVTQVETTNIETPPPSGFTTG